MRVIFLFAVFLFPCCAKEKSCEGCVSQPIVTNATIIWTGEVEVDGCDWCLIIDSANIFHPEFLDTAFMHDQLKVKVTYEVTPDTFLCGFTGKLPVVRLLSIEK